MKRCFECGREGRNSKQLPRNQFTGFKVLSALSPWHAALGKEQKMLLNAICILLVEHGAHLWTDNAESTVGTDPLQCGSQGVLLLFRDVRKVLSEV